MASGLPVNEEQTIIPSRIPETPHPECGTVERDWHSEQMKGFVSSHEARAAEMLSSLTVEKGTQHFIHFRREIEELFRRNFSDRLAVLR